MIECKQTKSIVIAVDGTLDNFSNWLAELNAFNERAYRKMINSKTNAELVRMVKCDNIQEDDLIYLPRKRLVEVANLLDA